jgi:SAM-dependent methyltransferase
MSLDFQKIYDSKYYNTDNYINYNGFRYRLYHLFRYLILGLFYKYFLNVHSVLDVGCATGMSVWVFRNLLGLEAYGVDVSSYAANNSIKSVKKYIYRFNIQSENLTKLTKEKLDLVVSYDAIEHLETDKIEKTMNNIFSVTDKAVFGIYVMDEPVSRIHNLLGIIHKTHFSEYTSSWWIDKLSSLNLAATRLPFSRKGSLLVRKKEAKYWA